MNVTISVLFSLSLASAATTVAISEPAAKAVAVAGAPVALTGCHADGEHRYSDVVNRTHHPLKTFSVEWDVYGANGKMLGGASLDYTTSPALGAGDASSYYEDVTLEQLGVTSPAAARKVTCRIISAAFADGKSWAAGKHWAEALLPLSSTASSGGNGGGAHAAPPPPPLRMEVANAWNDTVNGMLYIHDALIIHGGSSEVTVTPQNFVLTMALANGGRKAYGALTQAAPTYQKMTLTGQNGITAYEVDPTDDLGSLGSLAIPAGGTVKITVTFPVVETVANPNDNRNVTMQ